MPDKAQVKPASGWPRKVELFGVQVSPTNYADLTQQIINAARERQSAVVSCHAVHALVESSCDPELRRSVNRFDVVTPDGQPVRWALNLLYGTGLSDRVYGPQLTLDICAAAAKAGVSVYLYGGSPTAVSQMAANLQLQYPGLKLAGYESPPYRPLSSDEHRQVATRINQSGAAIVFIGLGFPKQDEFADLHRHDIQAVQVCVGAAFDFHAGTKAMAPAWMQRHGLEWLFRLSQEPTRLFRRYCVTNSKFLWMLAWALPSISRRRAAYAKCNLGDARV